MKLRRPAYANGTEICPIALTRTRDNWLANKYQVRSATHEDSVTWTTAHKAYLSSSSTRSANRPRKSRDRAIKHLRCGVANVRVPKHIVLHIKTPRTTPCDIFYDGHNLAACLTAVRHHYGTVSTRSGERGSWADMKVVRRNRGKSLNQTGASLRNRVNRDFPP